MRRCTHRVHPYPRAQNGVAVLALACLSGPFDVSIADGRGFSVESRLHQPTKKIVSGGNGKTGGTAATLKLGAG